MLRPMAGIGVLLLFISMFLPWLNKNSLIFGFDPELALNASIFSLVVILVLAGFIGGLYTLGRRQKWSPVYPGLMAILAGGFWLYQLSGSGMLAGLRSSGILSGPYICIAGGVLLAASSAINRRGAAYQVDDYPRRERDYPPRRWPQDRPGHRGPSFRMPRVRIGVWVLTAVWLIATFIVAQFLLAPSSPVWYVVDVIGVIAGLWLGASYFRWLDRSTRSPGKLFLVTIGSFILFPIIGGFTLGLYPQTPCTVFSSLPGCQGVSYSPTLTNFYAPTYLAGFINSFICFTTPLAIVVLLAALYGGYRLAHTVFVR